MVSGPGATLQICKMLDDMHKQRSVPAGCDFETLVDIGIMRCRGRIRLSGAAASDPLRIESRILSDPADLKALTEGLKVCREIGYSPAFDRFRGKEVMPGKSAGMELEELYGRLLATSVIKLVRRRWAPTHCRWWMPISKSMAWRTCGLLTHPFYREQ